MVLTVTTLHRFYYYQESHHIHNFPQTHSHMQQEKERIVGMHHQFFSKGNYSSRVQKKYSIMEQVYPHKQTFDFEIKYQKTGTDLKIRKR